MAWLGNDPSDRTYEVERQYYLYFTMLRQRELETKKARNVVGARSRAITRMDTTSTGPLTTGPLTTGPLTTAPLTTGP